MSFINHSEESSDISWFEDDGTNIGMLNDNGRNRFYDQALKSICQNKTVVDIGAGTGYLTALAIKHGAKHVTAVEASSKRCAFLKNMIEKLGYQDRVTIVNKNYFDTDLHSDIVVSETIGAHIYNENWLRLADHARTRCQYMIPEKFSINIDLYENHPIWTTCMQESMAFNYNENNHPEFADVLNKEMQLEDRGEQANTIPNLFSHLHNFEDIRLNKIWQSAPIVIDHMESMVVPEIIIPSHVFSALYEKLQRLSPNDWVFLNINWHATFQTTSMWVSDTIWQNVCKCIAIPKSDLRIYFSEQKNKWMFQKLQD
jgi:FkbM family methyltransferase